MLALLKTAIADLQRRGTKQATQLVKLDVRNIAAVKHPANGRRFLLVKSADGSLAVRPATLTYDDALMQRRLQQVYAMLGERFGALAEVFDGIRATGGDASRARVEGALKDFIGSIDKALPQMFAAIDGQRDGGEPVEKSAMARLGMARAWIGERITEAESEDSTMAGKKLTAADYQAFGEQIDNHLQRLLGKSEDETGVNLRERLVSAYLDEHPGITRDTALGIVYESNKGLFERCRAETTVGKDGRKVSETQVIGIARKSGGELAAVAEVDRRIDALMAKSGAAISYERARDAVFAEDRAAGGTLYERWRAESRA